MIVKGVFRGFFCIVSFFLLDMTMAFCVFSVSYIIFSLRSTQIKLTKYLWCSVFWPLIGWWWDGMIKSWPSVSRKLSSFFGSEMKL